MDFSSQLPKPQKLHFCRCPELMPFPQSRLLAGLAWKGPLNIIYSPTLLGWAGTFFRTLNGSKHHPTRPSNTSRDRALRTFLLNLFQCPSNLIVKSIILMPNLNLSIFSLTTLLCALLLQALAESPLYVPQDGVPWAFSSPGCTTPTLPASPHWWCVFWPLPVPSSAPLYTPSSTLTQVGNSQARGHCSIPSWYA